MKLMPENPAKAIAARDAAIRRIGKPLNALGGFAISMRCLTPAKIRIAIVKPSADERPKTTLSPNP